MSALYLNGCGSKGDAEAAPTCVDADESALEAKAGEDVLLQVVFTAAKAGSGLTGGNTDCTTLKDDCCAEALKTGWKVAAIQNDDLLKDWRKFVKDNCCATCKDMKLDGSSCVKAKTNTNTNSSNTNSSRIR